MFKEDDKGGSGKANRTKYKRTYKWNERNQLVSSVDSSYNTAYVYGQDGQRSNKYTQNSETLYFNKMWTLHTDSGNNIYGGQTAKKIYLDDTRIVTKLNSGHEPTYNEEYYKQYYYHSDHLGSASLITDYKGDEYQRIEYTPYGETWVEKTDNTGLEYLPYRFTGKEIDEETGLYYYGARYLDPRYSRWISTDPALGDYIPQAPVNDEAKKSNQNLPGMGGVFNTVNLQLYHYAGNNPIKYTDPDGREDFIPFTSFSSFVSFLFTKDENFKTIKTYGDSLSGDASAQILANTITKNAINEIIKNTGENIKSSGEIFFEASSKTAGIISEVTGDIALAGFATGQPEIAFSMGSISTIAGGAEIPLLGLKALCTGNKKDMEKFKLTTESFALSIGTNYGISKGIQYGFKDSVSTFNADATAAFTDKILQNYMKNEDDK